MFSQLSSYSNPFPISLVLPTALLASPALQFHLPWEDGLVGDQNSLKFRVEDGHGFVERRKRQYLHGFYSFRTEQYFGLLYSGCFLW